MKRRFRSRLPAPVWLQRRRLRQFHDAWTGLAPLFRAQRETFEQALVRCAEMNRETDAMLVRCGLKAAPGPTWQEALASALPSAAQKVGA